MSKPINLSSYKIILVALDLHDDVSVVLSQAGFLAKQYQAKLHIVHVLPHVYTSVPYAYDFQAEMEKDAEKRLAKVKSESVYPVTEAHLVTGSPKHEILELAKKIHADLLVVGSHGKHGVQLLLGSTANSVLHGAVCDVLTIRIDYSGRGEAHGPYHHLVVASDLREEGRKVLARAQCFVQDFKATWEVVHVVPDEATLASIYVPNIEEDLAKQAEIRIKKLAHEYQLKESEVHVLRGEAKLEISDYLTSSHSDLLVVGSHGRSLLQSAFLGSTANALLHGAKQDVLVVKI